jgi:hypothetical protein
LLIFLIGYSGFPQIVMPSGQGCIHLSLEEVVAHADHEVLMEIKDNSVLLIGDP